MPKYNLAQKIAWVPYTVIRAPLFILREGIKQSYFFSQKAPNPRELLTSEDRLVALYPAASFGGQGGFTGQLTFFHKRFLKDGNEFRLKGAYSASSFQNHYIRYRAYNLIGPVDAQIRGRFYVNPEDRFFGIGPDLDDITGDGDQDDETNFRHEQLGGDFIVGATWHKFFRTEVFADITKHTIQEGEGSTPSTTERFNNEETPGLEETTLLGVGARLAFDSRDNDFYPTKGVYASVAGTLFNDTDESEIQTREYKFTRYNWELSSYLNIWRNRIIAVRLLGEINTGDPESGEVIPFYELADLGGKDYLRGYISDRFRDKDRVLLNLEYRYPVWEGGLSRVGGADAVIFADIGRVFDDLTEDTTSDYNITYGVGFRARALESFLLRLEFAHSDEGNRILFGFAPLF